MTFDPTSVEVTCVTLPKDHCVRVPWEYIKGCGYSEPFCWNLNQRSLTPRWPLNPHLLRSHVWLYPRIIVSKSHGNTSMYVDTVINFAKITTYIHILHTTYTYYILRTESVITYSLSELRSGETKMSKSKQSYPWINQFITRQMRKCDRHYRKYKSADPSRKSRWWKIFKRQRNYVTNLLRKSHKNYVENVIGDSLDSNPKQFGTYQHRKSLGIPSLMVDNNTYSSDKGIA